MKTIQAYTRLMDFLIFFRVLMFLLLGTCEFRNLLPSLKANPKQCFLVWTKIASKLLPEYHLKKKTASVEGSLCK